MFKQCCGCKKVKKDKDDGDDIALEKTGDKDQADNNKVVTEPPVVNKSANEEVKAVETDSKKNEVEVNVVESTEKTEAAAPAPATEDASKDDANKKKDPGLTIDIKTENGNDEDEDTDVIPITPRTAKGLTPYPVKRNSTPGLSAIPKWLSQDEDEETGGTAEPPVTPVGRDELALRRHRFFSDLLVAAQAATEHRVRFDPLGPSVAEVSLPLPEKAMSVNAYTDIIQGPLATYLQLSAKIGAEVASHAQLVNEAFQSQLQYLKLAEQRSAPSQSEEMQLLKPTSDKIQAIQELRERNRASEYFNHLSAISESIPALGWVTVSPAPAPHIKEMNDAGQFYTNRVLKDWKQKNAVHAEWVKAWIETLSELQKFVKQHHTTGLVWSKKGGGAPPPPPPPGGMPPPPPVLPPIGDLTIDDSHDRSALFAQINQGEKITSNLLSTASWGLKKVTADMQTHKNPSLRSGPAPFKAPACSSAPPTKPVKAPPSDKPPVFARDGKKWIVEHQRGNHALVVEGAEMNNVVYMYGCLDSTLTVKGKINSVVLDSCRKSAIVFDSLVSSVEFVNCQSVQMQVLGKVPTISIDKTDGCQMYLSPESMDVEIVSSKSSEMNVLVPKGNGDFTEYPIPEQFKTTVSPRGLTTVVVESKG